MKSAYINSYQIHSNTANPNGIYLHTGWEGLGFPELRLSNYVRPGEHGAFVSNNLYGGRRIFLRGTIHGTNLTTYETARREFIKNLALTKDASNIIQPIVLKMTTMDDLALQVDVHVKDYRLEKTNLFADEFYLDLYAPDFFLESQSLSSSTVLRSSGGGAIYPVIYPVVYSATTGGTEIIINNGTAEAYPIITINGPITNPIIENSTVDRYIELTVTLGSGETVTIDMRNRTILKGSQSIIGDKSGGSKFWYLESGSNTIRFLTSNTGDTGNIQIGYRDSYLGI